MPTSLGYNESREDVYVSIPLGGPIYVPDMVGSLTGVSTFETSVLEELQSLKEEISDVSVDLFDEDISVDELKIIGEEELIARAFEEAFKAGEMVADATEANKVVEGNVAPSSNHDDSTKAEVDMWAVVPTESVDVVPLETCVDEKRSISVSRKTKRGLDSKKDDCFDESYMEKVEQLSRIKQKQEEDKKSVRLHSFSSGSKKRGSGAASKNDHVVRSLRFSSVSKKVKASNTSNNVPLDSPSTVLTFEVYHSRKPGFKAQEFLILGGQFLTEAKDKISCASDEMMKKAGVYDPSGYFLIEDCFYNDMRSPCASDYSEPVFTWLENSKDEALEKWEYIISGGLHQKQKAVLGSSKKIKLPEFRSFPMETTRFCDLRFRLGAGYLYCHQGDCKHIVVFRDMRLVHPEDVQSRGAYPLVSTESRLRRKKCCICKINAAHKVTVDDKWAPSNPSLFCDVCYYMLHYADGRLLYGGFSVYDYLPD